MDPTPDECYCLNSDRPTTSATWLGKSDGLSAHEGALVALIVIGLSNQEIARALYMSVHSAKTHIRSAYRKMGVTSRPQAIAWGNLHGFHLIAPARPDENGL